jgi:DNA-binding transcriptional regulator of glucitol operon
MDESAAHSETGSANTSIWFTRRAVKLHVVILIVVPAFLALCFWQLSRALGGNSLSWAYVFEWPLFAAYAVYMWWRFVHEAAEGGAPPAPAAGVPGGDRMSATTDSASASARSHEAEEAEEDAELAAYNTYLAELAEKDKATGR